MLYKKRERIPPLLDGSLTAFSWGLFDVHTKLDAMNLKKLLCPAKRWYHSLRRGQISVWRSNPGHRNRWRPNANWRPTWQRDEKLIELTCFPAFPAEFRRPPLATLNQRFDGSAAPTLLPAQAELLAA